MIYVGIDVAKDKHDCHIFDSNGAVLCDFFPSLIPKRGLKSSCRLQLDLRKINLKSSNSA